MKKSYIYVILVLIAWNCKIFGQQAMQEPAPKNNTRQNPIQEFDPLIHPIAVEIDSSTIFNVVSDYILVKSLQKGSANLNQIKEVSRVFVNGRHYLSFRTAPKPGETEALYVNILLEKKNNGQYFASSTMETCTGSCNCAGCSCGSCRSVPAQNTQVALSKINQAND